MEIKVLSDSNKNKSGELFNNSLILENKKELYKNAVTLFKNIKNNVFKYSYPKNILKENIELKIKNLEEEENKVKSSIKKLEKTITDMNKNLDELKKDNVRRINNLIKLLDK